MRPVQQSINESVWPEGYRHLERTFFIRNEITVNASAASIWKELIRAEQWPSWYRGAKKVSIEGRHRSVLEEGSVFSWQTMGLRFESTVMECKEFSFLAWESKKRIIQGYHVWHLIPENGGCRVVTEEAQKGWLTWLERVFQPDKLSRLHDEWLLNLKKRVEQP